METARILIVEDEVPIAELLQYGFQKEGFAVCCAQTAGAAAADTGDSGNITGDLSLSREGLTRMELIPRDAELSAGSLLMTTGLTGSFPEGILIGEVVEVQMEESGISLWASVRPAADIEGASSVFVVTDFPGKGADEETSGS